MIHDTYHRIITGDARSISIPANEAVDLVVTSPPYPMIEMWDGIFADMNPQVHTELDNERGEAAFELMHAELDTVWKRVTEAVRPGGFICINVGDAARRVGDNFRLYPNHARITEFFRTAGLQALPIILWNKPTNAPNKFMGSGMLPAGAYVTLEHEYILIFRKGGKRTFPKEEEKQLRRRSAFFWEERNAWFSDRWTFLGTRQGIGNGKGRERSGAYPFELAYRLICMYSLQGERVLDPFLGTGTTTFAAMAAGRNSLGFEIDENMKALFREQVKALPETGERFTRERLSKHISFLEDYSGRGKEMKHYNDYYGFPVVTSQEKELVIPILQSVVEEENSVFKASYNSVSRETDDAQFEIKNVSRETDDSHFSSQPLLFDLNDPDSGNTT